MLMEFGLVTFQLQDPWGPIRFLGNYLPLETIYKLKKIESDARWSPWEITLAAAKQKGIW